MQGPDSRFRASRADLDEIDRLNRPRPDADPGTLGGLFAAWRESLEFKALRGRTRADYAAIMAWLAPTAQDQAEARDKAALGAARAVRRGAAPPPPPRQTARLADMPLRSLTPPQVLAFRDKAFKARGRRFANYVVSVLSSASSWAVPRGYLAHNPCRNVPKVKRPKAMLPANPPWNPAERAAALAYFRAKAPQLVLPHLLGVYGGLREGDVIALPPTAWDGRAFRHRASKNGEERELAPPPAALKAALDEAAVARAALETKGKVLPPRLCVNSYGQAWTVAGFRASYFKALRALIDAKQLRPGRTFHSHRHGVGVAMAEAGLSEEEIKAYLANRSSAAAQVYTRQAERKRLVAAGVAALDASIGGEE